jgi:hypothetical protein
MMLVHCFLLGGLAFGGARLLVLSWWFLVLLHKEIDHYSWTFLLYFFGLCATVMPIGQCVVAETECNWYLGDVTICSLSKKIVSLGRN